MSDPGTEQPPLGVPDDPFEPPSDDPGIATNPDGTPKENPSG
jgi:hypothetical protein